MTERPLVNEPTSVGLAGFETLKMRVVQTETEAPSSSSSFM